MSRHLAGDWDTIVVPAREDGFTAVFLGQRRWHAIKIAANMLPKIKWIAAYRVKPISAITHIAKVAQIRPYTFKPGKYELVFEGDAVELRPIPAGDSRLGHMQSPRYANREKLLSAVSLADLFRADPSGVARG